MKFVPPVRFPLRASSNPALKPREVGEEVLIPQPALPDVRFRHIGVAVEFANDFPAPAQRLWTIAELGGWTTVDPSLFDKDNGTITKIYKQATG